MATANKATRYDVTAVGNAIVDVIGKCDDALLAKVGAQRGAMRLVDAAQVAEIYAAMGPAVEISGGSAANTAVGIASFGGRAGFTGSIADDEFGRIFSHDVSSIGVAFNGQPVSGGDPTSRSLILVTPDGERSMNTYLGISTQFDEAALDSTLVADSAVLYLEGYLFDREPAKAAFKSAFDTAKANGRQVALTLSDGFCVDRHRDSFLSFIKSGVDIVFANESEIISLYQTANFDAAAAAARRDAPLVVLTRSAAGSIILAGGNTVAVPAAPVAQVVDTTGAGDLYAAGFLFGLTAGKDLATCGKLASLAAAEIISHIGARPETPLRQVAEKAGISL